jgi:transposase, IS30 family
LSVAYTRLSEEERIGIEALWGAGLTMAQIARQLGRHRSTISRELGNNRVYRFSSAVGTVNPRSKGMMPGRRGRYEWKYSARAGQRRARTKASQRRAASAAGGRKLDPGPLRDLVLAGLRRRWSPAQISRRLRLDHPDEPQWWVSHETVYQALYLQARGSLREELKDQVALRSGRIRRRRRPLAAGPVRSGRPWTEGWHISQRPAEANDRAVPGHWEGDLVIGKAHRSAIITLVERSFRFVMLGALPDGYNSLNVTEALTGLMRRVPEQLRRSLAWDNGPELARAAEFTLATGCPVYFADPHSPWQRGSNENTNGLLRQYFPKYTFDFNTVDQDGLDAVAHELNGRPRETLGWRKPYECLHELLSQQNIV